MSSEDYPDNMSQGQDSPRGKNKNDKLKVKSNATKEIETWARSKTDRRMDYARQSGQLSDNVTEQRMLQSKIMELSKERYKFISQNAYERKVFLDRQQRKTNVMKDLLRGIDVDKYVRRAGVLCGEMDAALAPKNPNKKLGGRLGLLDRLDPTKKSQNGGVKPGKYAEDRVTIRPHTTMPNIQEKSALRNGRKALPKTANAALNRRNTGEPHVNFSTNVETLPDLTWSRKDSRGTPMSVRRESQFSIASFDDGVFDQETPTNIRPKLTRAQTFTNSRSSRGTDMSLGSRQRALSYPNNGKNQVRGPTTDPRYFLLTKSLCDNYTPCMEIPAEEVVGVIQKIDTLHIPPRRVSEMQRKPKLNLKLQEFMAEHGLVFH